MKTWRTVVMKPWHYVALLACVAVLAVPIAGCSKGNQPPLGSVTGTVTLDGKPLANADVTFQPVGPGRAAMATTDDQGRYEMTYLNDVKGALVGSTVVMITTAKSGSDDGKTPAVPERLPKRYHKESTLKVEVAEGSNTFNFDLKSK